MNGNESLKRLKGYEKDHELSVTFTKNRGKGSHGTVVLGTARATL